MDTIYVIILFLGGIVTGLYGSTVGSGSLVSFPLLILSGLPTHIAIGTNRFSATLLELSSAVKFYKEKELDLKKGFVFGVIAGLGSIIGSKIVIDFNERILNIVIAVVFLLIFVVLMNQDRLGIKEKKKMSSPVVAYALTFLLGIYGGFFGGGFGSFIMFLLVTMGFSFVKSAAIGRLVGFIMSFMATIVFALNGLINYPYAISLGLGCAVGSWIGVSIAVKKGNKYIKFLFIIIILITVAKLILNFFNISFL